jgi:hypothetical protein
VWLIYLLSFLLFKVIDVMKIFFAFCLLFFSYIAHASDQQCAVKVEREVEANDGWLLFHLDDGRNVEINDQNQVLIGGEVVELSPEQRQAVDQYRNSIAMHMQRLSTYAKSNAKFLGDVIDDIGASLGAPEAFNELKLELDNFWQNTVESYQLNQGNRLPAGTFDALRESWNSQAIKAKALFDQAFIEQAWQALSEKFKQEGGLSLTAMSDMLIALEATISERLQLHSNSLEHQESNLCESLNDIAEQEKDLRDKIPELKDYQVFTI